MLFICCNQFLLNSCILSKPGVMFSYFAMSVSFYDLSECILLYFSHFIPAAVIILLVFLPLTVQFSLLFNKAGTAAVLRSFILFCFKFYVV